MADTPEMTPPRRTKFFSEARPFDATKDDCLLDAMEQAIELLQDCEIQSGFTILTEMRIDRTWFVELTDFRDNVYEGAALREALAAMFNATDA